ncbi:MAG: prepilin-type N-terminal cleavage/methylation domain-containing protein [Spirochaetota bacterium]
MGRKVKTRYILGAFTLIELLMAMSILAIISAVSYTSFVTVRRTSEASRRNEEMVREIRNFLEKLDAELTSALYVVNDKGTLFFSNQFEINGEKVNNLIFTAIEPQQIFEFGKRGEVVQIEYDVTRTEGDDEHLTVTKKLYYYTLPPRDFDRPVEFTVGDDFDSFILRFKDEGGWVDRWDTEKLKRLPEGIELIFKRGGKTYREFFNVFISEM